jgi:hypothetical protein
VTDIDLTVAESMFVLDGGPDALLPDGSGGPVLAGDEAIFVAGRVAADAPTHVIVTTAAPPSSLSLAYSGWLSTPEAVIRLANVYGDVLAAIEVDEPVSYVRIYLDDLVEPDEIFVQVEAGVGSPDRLIGPP